jgi:hypothetical protein
MKYVSLALQILLLASCANHETKKEIQEAAPLQPPAKQDSAKSQPLTFFDSVARGDDLSIAQIRMHTQIDSSRYTEPYIRAAFKGDTVFKMSNGYTAVVIRYYDGMATTEKYLLIYNHEGTFITDNKIIFTDTDREGMMEDESEDYRFLTDTTFELIKSDIPEGSEKETKKKDGRFKINSHGIIERVR